MNREIIFRGKREKTGEWVYGYLVKRDEPFLHDIVVPVGNASQVTYAVIRETVSQYTGMNDKNGKRIFEGDIVRNPQGKTAYITFLQQEMGYVAVHEKYDSRIGHRATGSPCDYDDTIEVCGNVYDSPEFLVAK